MLTVQSEKPPAYAGRRERQAPAPRLQPPEAPYFHVVRSPRSSGAGRSKAGESTITKTRQRTRKIFGKKRRGRMACNFTEADVQAECVRREQELEDAGLLALDGGRYISGREAERERLEDYELCRDSVSEFARHSARRAGEAIGDIRDRYETIVAEFRAARYLQSDGRRYLLSKVLLSECGTDKALKDFLHHLGKWIKAFAHARLSR